MASSTVIATLDTSVRIPWVVTLLAMTLGVVVGFRLQRRHQHPPRSEPCDLIQLKKLLACFPSSSTLYYLQHQWRLLPPLPPGFALPTRKATPPFSLPHLSHNFR